MSIQGWSVRPLTGDPADADRATTVHRRADRCEDRPLQGGGGDDLAPAPVLVGGVRGVVVAGGQLPALLEHEARDGAGADAQQQTDGPVGHLLKLLAHFRLPRTMRMMPIRATPAARTAANGTGLRCT